MSCDRSANASVLVACVHYVLQWARDLKPFSCQDRMLSIISTESRETTGAWELNFGQSPSLLTPLSISQPGSRKCLINTRVLPPKRRPEATTRPDDAWVSGLFSFAADEVFSFVKSVAYVWERSQEHKVTITPQANYL